MSPPPTCTKKQTAPSTQPRSPDATAFALRDLCAACATLDGPSVADQRSLAIRQCQLHRPGYIRQRCIVRNHDDLAEVVTRHIAGIPGIVETRSMVAFRAYSKHDLESMFSLGGD